MSIDIILIDVYDRHGNKLIEGITPINPANQALPSLKDFTRKIKQAQSKVRQSNKRK